MFHILLSFHQHRQRNAPFFSAWDQHFSAVPDHFKFLTGILKKKEAKQQNKTKKRRQNGFRLHPVCGLLTQGKRIPFRGGDMWRVQGKVQRVYAKSARMFSFVLNRKMTFLILVLS